jgi:hypothetical protein
VLQFVHHVLEFLEIYLTIAVFVGFRHNIIPNPIVYILLLIAKRVFEFRYRDLARVVFVKEFESL